MMRDMHSRPRVTVVQQRIRGGSRNAGPADIGPAATPEAASASSDRRSREVTSALHALLDYPEGSPDIHDLPSWSPLGKPSSVGPGSEQEVVLQAEGIPVPGVASNGRAIADVEAMAVVQPTPAAGLTVVAYANPDPDLLIDDRLIADRGLESPGRVDRKAKRASELGDDLSSVQTWRCSADPGDKGSEGGGVVARLFGTDA